MYPSDTIDGMRPHNGQMRHVHSFLSVFLHQRHPPQPIQIPRPLLLHLLQVQQVYVVDDLQVPGQDRLQHGNRPPLQGLRKNGVVGVRARLHRYFPRFLPRETLDVHQEAHQLGDGHGRVRVVQLDGHLLREQVEVRADAVSGAEFRRFEAADDVLEGCGAHEVFLLQAELLALEEVVVGVEHSGDVLGQVAVEYGLDVVAVVD